MCLGRSWEALWVGLGTLLGSSGSLNKLHLGMQPFGGALGEVLGLAWALGVSWEVLGPTWGTPWGRHTGGIAPKKANETNKQNIKKNKTTNVRMTWNQPADLEPHWNHHA